MKNYYLGIDVSKGYGDFLLIDQKKKTIENSFQLDDNFTGHQQLCSILTQFFIAHEDSIVFSGLESTGGYENNWYKTLHGLQAEMNIRVTRLNPLGVHHNSKAGLKRITTDKESAMNIAEYLIDHSGKVSYEQTDYYYTLRRQWKFIRLLIKQRTQIFNQLEKVVYSSNPEILLYCRSGMPQWVLKLLRQYPTAALLSKARASCVAKIPYITHETALELIAQAKGSTASAQDQATALTVSAMVEQIENLNRQIELQEDLIARNFQTEEVKLLKSFKGIGDYTAVGLLMEIGTIERFPTAKHLASYFGLHPVFRQSGDKTWGIHMSKQGRKEARYLLYNVAFSAIQHNPLIKELYAGYLQRGKQKSVALGMIMHKILRIIYGMLKNGEPFKPEKDRLNRSRQDVQRKSQNPLADNKVRRYHLTESNAPVSARQNKKRKEKELSQNEILSFSAGSDPFSS